MSSVAAKSSLDSRLRLLALAAGSIVTFAATASADERPPADPPPEPARVEWYGWQNLLIDAGSIGAGLVTKSPEVFTVGYLLGGPIVHWLHGGAWQGFASLGLRVGAPFVFGAIGYAADASHCDGEQWVCGVGGLAIGALAGYVVAVAVDASVFAYERAPAGHDRDEAQQRPKPWRL